MQSETVEMICLSDVKSTDYDIPYGGIDEQGVLKPGTRHRTLWDDEEEEEDYFDV